MAFFLLIRRSSLFDTNQRFRRTVLRMPLLATFLRKRFSSCSCDSFGRSVTEVNFLTSFRRQHWFKKRSADERGSAEQSIQECLLSLPEIRKCSSSLTNEMMGYPDR